MTNKLDPIWNVGIEKYDSFNNESRKTILHPRIAKIIKGSKNKILEYGCGDGNLIKEIKKDNEFSIYDVSENAIKFSQKKLSKYKPQIYKKISDIPENYFDYIIFSLVLVTINDKNNVKYSFDTVYKALNSTGTLILATTHPCFRQYFFSTFNTSYSKKQEFNYMNEGEKFKVTLVENQKELSFFDYHWSLSFTINTLLKSNLNITEIIELPDISSKEKYYNKNFCPYIIITCSKA